MNPAWRSFRHRNYRLFFGGQFVSLLGTWLQTVAMVWLVYRLTGSPLMLGFASGAQQLPVLFLAPFAGVLADRVERRKLLLITQALACVQALLFATLTFTGVIHVWHVIALALMLGFINAVETPTRQAFVLDMVGSKDDLPNAIALNSMLFNSARFIGPAIAGLVLSTVGEAWCFTLNAVSFIATLWAYAQMRVTRVETKKRSTHWWRDLTSGMRYAFAFTGTRRLLLLLVALSICSAGWQPLMPIFASKIFSGDERTLGFLIGAVGTGALVGTIYLMRRPSARGLGKVIGITTIISGVGLALFALSTWMWLSLPLLAVFGFGLIATVASCNTLLQTIAEEDKRGRVISLYVVAFLGMSPIGQFVSGALAEAIGADCALLLCGLGMVTAGFVFRRLLPSWRESVRQARMQRDMAATQVPRQ